MTDHEEQDWYDNSTDTGLDDDTEDDDPHAGCYQPHGNTASGYYNCDGRPL